jgi:hypothetical protein
MRTESIKLFTHRGDYVATVNDTAPHVFNPAPDILLWGTLPRVFKRKNDQEYYEAEFTYFVVDVSLDDDDGA